ncbi:MAG: FtsH protease activity modulator HflK [Gammaproteobacteria bacterium]|nr:FtsH protease activity modulator HflK [Gammaproteobacteria bacterium]
MAWNEPGGGKDPWGGRNGDQGPPDLDEVLKRMQSKLGGIFGGRRGGGGGGAGRPFGIGLLVAIVVVVWLLSGIYIVGPAERGVVLRFGEYQKTTLPGPHWHLPYPVETAEIVDVARIRNVEIGYRTVGEGVENMRPVAQESLMLTQDENIIDLQIAVQYRVNDAQRYLFNVRRPDETLKAATESALREVVGKSKMDFVLTEGRREIATGTRELTQRILDAYGAGLEITNVTMQKSQPPEPVQPAFEDAIKAREDEQKLKNQAHAYANEVIQRARGRASRRREEAQGYKESLIAQAEGEGKRFLELLREYEQAPRVTRKRLYLETMEDVLSSTTKITVDLKAGNSLLFLPLERLLGERAAAAAGAGEQEQEGRAQQQEQQTRDESRSFRDRESLRLRGTR